MKRLSAGTGVSLRILIVLVILSVTDRTGFGVATLLAALWHECGHLLAARLMHIPLRNMQIDFTGARLEIGGRMLGFGEEWMLAAAGPTASLFGGALAGLFWEELPVSLYFSAASLLLGILNLLPVRSFDGGRMLECMLSRFLSVRLLDRTMQLISFLFLFLLWATAAYFLIRVGNGISLFFFSLCLFLRFLENDFS